MVHIPAQKVLGLAFLCLPLLVRATNPVADAVPSPAADTELICPTDNAAECYPRVFSPTEDFQDIKEGQDIPPGLHVRMNIYTGQKEARLNIPMEGDEVSSALEGLPTEQAIVVVEQPEQEPEQTALRDQVPQKPPPYEAAGKIQPPPPTETDFGTFQKAILAVQMEARAFDQALDELKELSHDVYYGKEIAKDGPVLERLICLILGSGSEKFPAKDNKRDAKAAAILANAIQNNPTALKEVGTMGRLVMYPTCAAPIESTKKPGNFVSTLKGRLGREKDPATLKSKVVAISGLIRDPTIRQQFLEKDGMEMLLAIWLKKGEQWDTVRMKVAQLVMDNFLDEEMGAELDIWPSLVKLETYEVDPICKTKATMLSDGCWEHHIKAFLNKSPNSDWAVDFLKTLEEQRPQKKGGARNTDDKIRHGEL